MLTKQIVLPADEFDALELAAMEFGGIGAGEWFKNQNPTCPVCINGLGIVAGVHPDGPAYARQVVYGHEGDTPTHLTTWSNDIAVRTLVNEGRYTVGADGVQRVTWADYCEQLNIVRGS